MWVSEGDKYWKEKRKAKQRQENIRAAKFVGLAILFIFILFNYASPWSSLLRKKTLKGVGEAGPHEEVAPSEQILAQCKQTCRTKVIDECNNKCRFALTEYPRPTIFRACQAPCVAVAQAMCSIGTDPKKFVRENCKLSGKSMCYRRCKEYENVMPKPRASQVCHEGCDSIFPYACAESTRCVARNTIRI